jgi:hypothetical protein
LDFSPKGNKKLEILSDQAFGEGTGCWLGLRSAKVPESLYGCLLGNNQLKVSCWEGGPGKKSLSRANKGKAIQEIPPCHRSIYGLKKTGEACSSTLFFAAELKSNKQLTRDC